MTDESGAPDEGAKGRLAPTPLQQALLKNLAAGKREPLGPAKTLRPAAHFPKKYSVEGLEERFRFNCQRIWHQSHWSLWMFFPGLPFGRWRAFAKSR
jgi:hypothetical protein